VKRRDFLSVAAAAIAASAVSQLSSAAGPTDAAKFRAARRFAELLTPSAEPVRQQPCSCMAPR
jgi:anaerobic selenocysteine-containing dehydrogenase